MTPSPNTTLHILNKHPDHERFRVCLGAMAAGDSLLLIENAVIALADTSLRLPPGTHVLKADCQARGLGSGANCQVEQLDYAGMVQLTDRSPRLISW